MILTIRPYSHEEELRALSFQYAIDAHQFAKQAEIILADNNLFTDCQYHLGYLSKVSVTLYMSIECSLKSLICATHIGEDPHSVYWSHIRSSSHSFEKLKNKIPNYSAVIGNAGLENEIDRLTSADVSERYCLEISSESDLLSDFNIDEDKLTESIEATRTLLRTAKEIYKIAWSFRGKAFENHRTLPPDLVKSILQRIKTK